MLTKAKTKLGGFGASSFIWLACMLSILPDASFASTSPVSEDGSKWTSDDLNGPAHVVQGTSTNLRLAGNEWIEDQPNDAWIVRYDRAKVVIEKEWLHPIVKPPLPPKTFTCLARDPSGKIVQSFACNAEKSPIDEFRQVFLYNSKEHLAEQQMIHLDERPSLTSRKVYEYDGAGQRVAEHEYDAQGALRVSITLDRNEGKNTVTVYARSGEGVVWSKSRHLLDGLGHSIESLSLDADDQILSTYRRTYDSQGNWIEQISSGRGPDYRTVISYEYDRWQNWTQKTIQEIGAEGERRWVVRRIIEYFPD